MIYTKRASCELYSRTRLRDGFSLTLTSEEFGLSNFASWEVRLCLCMEVHFGLSHHLPGRRSSLHRR